MERVSERARFPNPTRVKLTQQRLEAHLMGAAHNLRGRTPGQDYKNYILLSVPDGPLKRRPGDGRRRAARSEHTADRQRVRRRCHPSRCSSPTGARVRPAEQLRYRRSAGPHCVTDWELVWMGGARPRCSQRISCHHAAEGLPRSLSTMPPAPRRQMPRMPASTTRSFRTHGRTADLL